MSFAKKYFEYVTEIATKIDYQKIESLVALLTDVRTDGGRLFFLGVGGSAGNAGHAVNDFRKLCGFEAYAPTDNVSELTARTNDEGWETVFAEWLKTSRLSEKDVLFVFSVGGGNAERNVSMNIVYAMQLAKQVNAKVCGVVGKEDGYAAQNGDCVIVIPQVAPSLVTPLSEAYQAVVWHAIVSHPDLQINQTKW